MKLLYKNNLVRVVSVIISFVIITQLLAVPVNAHEFSPSRYWNDIYYHSGMNKHVVRIKVNMTNVTNEVYNRKLRDAMNDWEWLDNGYCHMETTTTDTTLMVYDSYPSTQNQTAFAVTVSYLSSASITYYPYTLITGGTTTISCNKINRAFIYANTAYQQAYNFGEGDIAHTWAHELGHVIGLNETNDGTQSVMKQGKGSTLGWDNYWQPQAHDTYDVSRYHRVTW